MDPAAGTATVHSSSLDPGTKGAKDPEKVSVTSGPPEYEAAIAASLQQQQQDQERRQRQQQQEEAHRPSAPDMTEEEEARVQIGCRWMATSKFTMINNCLAIHW